jgi:hypothetical protein
VREHLCRHSCYSGDVFLSCSVDTKQSNGEGGCTVRTKYNHYKKFSILRPLTCDPCSKTASKVILQHLLRLFCLTAAGFEVIFHMGCTNYSNTLLTQNIFLTPAFSISLSRFQFQNPKTSNLNLTHDLKSNLLIPSLKISIPPLITTLNMNQTLKPPISISPST